MARNFSSRATVTAVRSGSQPERGFAAARSSTPNLGHQDRQSCSRPGIPGPHSDVGPERVRRLATTATLPTPRKNRWSAWLTRTTGGPRRRRRTRPQVQGRPGACDTRRISVDAKRAQRARSTRALPKPRSRRRHARRPHGAPRAVASRSGYGEAVHARRRPPPSAGPCGRAHRPAWASLSTCKLGADAMTPLHVPS